jgi:2-isopropylmalate synthase
VSIEIYDTTLRDGAQGVGINFSVSDKLRIADHLDTLGVTVIEGGWPGANPTDTEFFSAMQHHPLRNATLAAFGATRRPGLAAQDDLQLRTLLDSMAPIITLVGKAWDRQVADVLRTTNDENLAMIGDSVRWFLDHGRRVVYDAEHIFASRRQSPPVPSASRCATPTGARSPIAWRRWFAT